ncbi:MAG: coproporphyrinogen III oxidase [Alphaproteobacteria bacterium]|nr:coproporphyrinogen III oxidase [Alphaproteobacteria bacterium]
MNSSLAPIGGEGCGEGASPAREPPGRRTKPPLGVYIHWPFCVSKCPYCDFNSHVRERIDAARWTRALLTDLERQAETAADREVVSIFFGGGTPSLMPPETVAALIARVRELWSTAPDLEVTLEANPNSADAARFAGFAAAGVNRLSLGIQSLYPAALRFLGRAHDRVQALDAIAAASSTFPRYSFDLIYARPDQDLDAWMNELDEALRLAGEHLSLYQLTIEARTGFGARYARGELKMPDEDTGAALFEATQGRLIAAGLPAYEISNHARPGAECRHNLVYWRYDDYLGIGPGAHGRVTRDGGKIATRQRRTPETWLSQIEATGTALDEALPVPRENAIEEMVMMGLRLREGISRDRLEGLAQQSTERMFAATLPRLIEGGFLTLDAECLTATPAGRQRLNAVLSALLI